MSQTPKNFYSIKTKNPIANRKPNMPTPKTTCGEAGGSSFKVVRLHSSQQKEGCQCLLGALRWVKRMLTPSGANKTSNQQSPHTTSNL
eukprot:2201931-Amphidinium_carterae.2